MTSLQLQARALGDPTRHAVFRYVVDAGRPVGVAELTEHFGFNHNAIRQHLAKLVAAGLVLEATAAPAGRGRPRLEYTADPAASGPWGAGGPYERLSRLLVEIIRSGLSPEEVGRRAADGFRVPTPSGDAVADIAAAMARQGFEPEVRTGRRRGEVVLRTCPFESAALADRETICALHLGIAEGLAEGTSVVVEELVANDPRRADCRIRLATVDTPDDAGAAATLSLRGSTTPRRRT
jgi:predicted ArsR family transcriptional regulator